jgi:polysaccharide biosynthesis protein PelD
MQAFRLGERITIEKVIFVEIFVLIAFLLALGWYFNREDPLFIKSKYDLINLLVVALSLYYGYSGAIVIISFLSAGYFFFYQPFPLNDLLQNLLFALLSSEFRYIWDKKIKLALAEKTYAEQMTELYRRQLFSLKLEYDLLERQFVLSPYSVRNILERFKVPYSKAFMELISDFFGVMSAELYKHEDGKLISVEKLGSGVKVDKEDPLIKEALELNTSFYIPPKDILRKATSEELNFIALVVAESYAGKFLLAIKDMDFLNINEEVLSYIMVLLEYYGDSIAFETSGFSCTKFCDREFELQAYRMRSLKEHFGIDSFVVVFEYPPERREEVVKLKSMVKGLDRVCMNEDKVLVLLPITPKEGVERFLERIRKDMNFLKVKEIKPIGEFCNVSDYIKLLLVTLLETTGLYILMRYSAVFGFTTYLFSHFIASLLLATMVAWIIKIFYKYPYRHALILSFSIFFFLGPFAVLFGVIVLIYTKISEAPAPVKEVNYELVFSVRILWEERRLEEGSLRFGKVEDLQGVLYFTKFYHPMTVKFLKNFSFLITTN